MDEIYFKRLQGKGTIGSYVYAKEIAELVKWILENKPELFEDINELVDKIQNLDDVITPYKPMEFSISNVIKRIISVIREQGRAQKFLMTEEREKEKQDNKFIIRLPSYHPTQKPDESSLTKNVQEQKALIRFRTEVMHAIDSIIEEFENLSEQINEYAAKHINNNEIIIVFGSSQTVTSLLIEAKKKKTFEVICVENNIGKNGHEMAKKLAEAKIKTTLIPDTAIYAVMHRVHKAFVSAHSIMANGGILGTSGSLLVALACKAHLVPMIVVGGMYKLTPKIPFEQDTYNELINPGAILDITPDEKIENIDVIIPGYDYIAPDYVTLYITNLGEHTPAYIYRVFSEHYVKQ